MLMAMLEQFEFGKPYIYFGNYANNNLFGEKVKKTYNVIFYKDKDNSDEFSCHVGDIYGNTVVYIKKINNSNFILRAL